MRIRLSVIMIRLNSSVVIVGIASSGLPTALGPPIKDVREHGEENSASAVHLDCFYLNAQLSTCQRFKRVADNSIAGKVNHEWFKPDRTGGWRRCGVRLQ